MKVACIDIGTNSALALVAEKKSGQWEVLLDRAEIIRLGEGMKTNKEEAMFLPQALERMKICLKSFIQEIEIYKPEKIYAFATAAARKAKNQEELLAIFAAHDLNLEIISGDREAELTFKGASFDLDVSDYAVLDIGGGSTEILWSENGKLVGQSLNIGAVVLKESFFPNEICSASEIAAAKKYIFSALKNLPAWKKENELLAVAGTPTTIVTCKKALPKYDRHTIHNYKLDIVTINKWLEKYNTPMLEKKNIIGLEEKRADIIFAGTLILSEVLNYLNIKACRVSVGGLRYGGIQE